MAARTKPPVRASELLTRALRLINIPGRGAQLSAEDQAAAFDALQEILDSRAVTKQFVPGITRHFFAMPAGRSIYTYGPSPDCDFRSDDFETDPGLGHPAPIKIEDAYLRQGASITDNELIDQYRFEGTGSWVLDASAAITNNQYKVEGAITSSTQALAAVAGRTYTLRLDAEINKGSVEIRMRNGASAFETYTIDTTGQYAFDFTWASGSSPDVEIATTVATDDIRLNYLSLIERGKDRKTLPDGQGSDYRIRLIDQTHYNRRFTKGTGGRPHELLYTRGYGKGELRFDDLAVAGDILVIDVLVNKVQVTRPSDILRLNPEAIQWLRYAVADNVAGEYGKALNPRQLRIMEESWAALASSNRRINHLGMDRALRPRPIFDINRGDV